MVGYSNVELANQALDHLGKDRIASLTENSTSARKLNEVFARTIYTALARSEWSFAKKIASLAALTNDWSERWAFKYDLPNDCLKFCRLVPRVDVMNAEPQMPFELLGGKLYCDDSEAKGQYVYQTTDTLLMPQPFLDAVSFLLARNVSMPLTRKRAYWNDLNQAFELQLSAAVAHDAGQQPNTYTHGAGGYIEARGGTTVSTTGAAPDGSIYWE